jgi:hypothetical protein
MSLSSYRLSGCELHPWLRLQGSEASDRFDLPAQSAETQSVLVAAMTRVTQLGNALVMIAKHCESKEEW